MVKRKKVLFITQTDILNSSNNYGGGVISKRNYNLLAKFCDVDICFPKHSRNIFEKIYYTFFKHQLYFINSEVKEILSNIVKFKYDCVFFDNSVHGNLVKKIKKLNCRVVSFFHNIESVYYKNVVGKRYYIVKQCEKLTVKYSDKLILLNSRDCSDLNRIYKRVDQSKIETVPITLDNDYIVDVNEKNLNVVNNERKIGLFFGSCFAPNLNGIKWFIDNVMPYVNFNLIIAGRGFGSKIKYLAAPNVTVYDEINDIKQLFESADFFVSPIFEGSGMKVKTCEALKFGKTIFGTNETFVGYELDFEKVGGICNSALEFINKINSYLKSNPSSKFNSYSRQIFCCKYTNEVALNKFKKVV